MTLRVDFADGRTTNVTPVSGTDGPDIVNVKPLSASRQGATPEDGKTGVVDHMLFARVTGLAPGDAIIIAESRYGTCVHPPSLFHHTDRPRASFDQLSVLVKPGDKITVVDARGVRTDGRVGLLSRGTLTLTTPFGMRQLGELDVAEIRQRRGDSLKNGAIIGAVSATTYYVIIGALFAGMDGGDVLVGQAITGGVVFAGLGAAAGAGIDALITRRQVIYRKGSHESSVTLSPLVGRGRRGAAITVRF